MGKMYDPGQLAIAVEHAPTTDPREELYRDLVRAMYRARVRGSAATLLRHVATHGELIDEEVALEVSAATLAHVIGCSSRTVERAIDTLRKRDLPWLSIEAEPWGTTISIRSFFDSDKVPTRFRQGSDKVPTRFRQGSDKSNAGTPRATCAGVTKEKNSLSENLKRGSRGTAEGIPPRERTRDAALPLLPPSPPEIDFVSWLDQVTREAGFHLAPSTLREVERQLDKSPLEQDVWQDFAMDRICDLADRRGERDDYALSRALREDCHTWVAPSQASSVRKSSRRDGCSGEETKVEETPETLPKPPRRPLRFIPLDLADDEEREKRARLAQIMRVPVEDVPYAQARASKKPIHWINAAGEVIRVEEVSHG